MITLQSIEETLECYNVEKVAIGDSGPVLASSSAAYGLLTLKKKGSLLMTVKASRAAIVKASLGIGLDQGNLDQAPFRRSMECVPWPHVPIGRAICVCR